MTLLKGDDSIPKKPQLVNITSWPVERFSGGIGLSIKDGWHLGVGFGLAMVIAIPLILMLISCIVGIGLTIVGSSLGALLGG